MLRKQASGAERRSMTSLYLSAATASFSQPRCIIVGYAPSGLANLSPNNYGIPAAIFRAIATIVNVGFTATGPGITDASAIKRLSCTVVAPATVL